MGALAKRPSAHEGRRLTRDPDGEQDLPVERALAHRVIAIVGEVDRVVRREVQPMRMLEDALAPGAQDIAVAVENDHRMVAAVKRIDIVVAIDAYRGDIVQAPIRGPFCPAFHRAVPEFT